MSAMPERGQVLVTNTTPLIALTAATGSLDILKFLYPRVVVPLEVADEVRAGGQQCFGVDVFNRADWLEIQPSAVTLQAFLRNSLDVGEASVIQTAMNLGLPLVCIDETAGRRVARLCGLDLTGSVGVLLKAKRLGFALSIPDALQRMREHGIWLSASVVQFALAQG
jgi:predicted nucleic acid-binding protein